MTEIPDEGARITTLLNKLEITRNVLEYSWKSIDIALRRKLGCCADQNLITEVNELARKTKKMTAVEDRYHQSLEKILPEMVTDNGLSATADQLGVSKATLGYWLLKLGINVKRVALAPGESLEVKRVG